MIIASNEHCLVVTTCADKDSARAVAAILVEKRLAACVQMFPIESVYSWQSKVCSEPECALFVKTRSQLFESVSAAIREHHDYELPEIIQLPITGGLSDYLGWIDGCTN
ncbi:MAG: divalent-cation tolerance protein CutA [Defluviitaleaceae bacterium]|nr:divalent-cation tolerance protein CutA [Defluviitaleaceae bacterium]